MPVSAKPCRHRKARLVVAEMSGPVEVAYRKGHPVVIDVDKWCPDCGAISVLHGRSPRYRWLRPTNQEET